MKLTDDKIKLIKSLIKQNKTHTFISNEVDVATTTIRHLLDPIAKAKCNERVKHNYRVLKREVLLHYSGGNLVCACCDESEYEFLVIDHEEGNGSEHRRQIKGNIYSWLKRNNYPKGYRILCANCNWSCHLHDGVCIHNINKQVVFRKTVKVKA
jgi:hypothetical protein